METDRYVVPKVPRNERKCSRCPVVEDEFHVLFECSLYIIIRLKFRNLYQKYNSTKGILNPITLNDAEELGSLLFDIENLRHASGLESLRNM